MMRRRLATFALGLLLATAGLRAQEPGVQVTGQGVLIDFQDADLRLVIAALAEAAGLNVIYGEIPARRVTLRMRQPMPQEGIASLLRSLSRANGLRVVEEEGFLRLEPDAQATRQAVDSAAPDSLSEVRLFVHRLRHAKAAELAATLQNVFGGGPGGSGRPGARPREPALSESLRLQGSPADSAGAPQMRVGVELGEQRASLPGTLSGEIQIVAEERTNSLLVRAQTGDWEVLRQTIETLDVRPLQVLIEVVIAEVRQSRDLGIGVSGDATRTTETGEVGGALTGGTPGTFVLEMLRQSGNLDLNLALSTLASRGQVRIISRPVVLAQNNQEARILIGSERPFVQASRSLPTDAGVRDQVIQYRDVGTKLTIVPTINEDGYVNLQVLQEVSTATAEVQFDAPIISTREASTHLFVRDGQTAVIGGLIDRQSEKTRSGIPVLMDIPVLGGLFGSRRETTTSSELFLFLTTHVVATDEDMERVRTGVRESTPLLRQALPDTVRIPIRPEPGARP